MLLRKHSLLIYLRYELKASEMISYCYKIFDFKELSPVKSFWKITCRFAIKLWDPVISTSTEVPILITY